jgi:hypothetical protein
MPDSAMYKLATEGCIESTIPEFPAIPSEWEWRPALKTPMRSALKWVLKHVRRFRRATEKVLFWKQGSLGCGAGLY